MTILQTSRLAIGAIIVLAGCGAVFFIGYQSRHRGPSVPPPPVAPSAMVAPPPVVHSAAWYVAHPDVLKQDEHRCAGDAATMTQAACQNVASADAEVAAAVFAKAAAENGAAGPKPSKAP